MNLRHLVFWTVFALAALPSAAGDLVLPAFALNLDGRFDDLWSSEIYLTNPGDQPVQVELARFLPGNINKPTPCDFFMPPTRVVPPYSATIWTAAGLATDLGCAERARGGLVLRADIPLEELPAAGSHLLPALMWHRNPCDTSSFDTSIGFANPGPDPVEIRLDVPHETARAVRINGREVFLPHSLTIRGGAWRQFRLSPIVEEGAPCGGVESFLVRLEIDGPVAIYGSVIDRKSGDPRTVSPVPLEIAKDVQPSDR
jgi:hypothetical protein